MPIALRRRATLVAAVVLTAVFAAMCLFGCSQPSDGGAATGEGAAREPAAGVEAADSADASADGSSDEVATPSTAGALQVVGSQLCDADGSPVQLRGVSTHGLAWYPGYVNQQFFDELRTDWNANVVRLAMYTAESGGYCAGGDQEQLYGLVRDGVVYAAEADLYAIVDWHILSDGNPLQHADEAVAFFGRMSAELASADPASNGVSPGDSVVYEICNEPNGGTTWDDVKAYAERVIPVIRANDPDAVVIVGTPTWSQDVDKAAASPLDAANVMYALHFYAATHQQDLRDRMATAVEGGLPVFVSEFGICDASGNGSIDYASADAWVRLMDELDVSYICWSLSNKDEASALFKADCSKTAGFEAADLSAEGEWLWGVLHSDPGAGGEAAAAADATDATAATGAAANGNAREGGADRNGATSGGTISGSTGAIGWTANVVNSWEADGRTFRQYAVSVTNDGATGVDGWRVTIPFGGAVELSDGWNGTFSAGADGASLTIESVGYNAELAPWASIQDVGFIVSMTQ